MTTERDHAERIPNILQRLASVETKLQGMDTLWKSSVDDIKATIRSEVSDLKSEQINDIKISQKQIADRIDIQSNRLTRLERTQDQWSTAKGVVNWLIRLVIAIGGIAVGIVGAKHVG